MKLRKDKVLATPNTADDTAYVEELVVAATGRRANVMARKELLEFAQVSGHKHTIVRELTALAGAGNDKARELLDQLPK